MKAVRAESDDINEISGGYCGGVPPLPIPNREVKPAYADGTAMQCGRVGSRLLLRQGSLQQMLQRPFLMALLIGVIVAIGAIVSIVAIEILIRLFLW